MVSSQHALWNQQSGIGLLPPEVIGRVFRHVAQDDRSLPLRRLTHVCRRWRCIAISDPSLWTYILLNVRPRGAEYAAALLHRSGSLPLSIDFEFSSHWKAQPGPTCRFAGTVMKHYQRIQRLRLSSSVLSALNPVLARYSACSWDALESLLVHARDIDFHWNIAPRLRFLSISFFDAERTPPSTFCFPTLRSLRVVGKGHFDLTGWTDALSQMPRLEELYLDIWTLRAGHAFDPIDVELDHIQRVGTVALNSLRRITLGLWSSQGAELLPHLTYREDVLVTLLLPPNLFDTGFQMFFRKVLYAARRKIGLDHHALVVQRCHIMAGLGRDHSEIEMTLHTTQSSPPYLRFRADASASIPGGGQAAAFYYLILPYLDNEGVEWLELPLKHYKAFVSTPIMGNHLLMPNVRRLTVPGIELDDVEALSLRNVLGQMAFPILETLIIDPPLPRRRKGGKPGVKARLSEAQRDAMLAGVVPALEFRRDLGGALPEIVLGPRAQSAKLLEDFNRSLPGLQVKLVTEEVNVRRRVYKKGETICYRSAWA